VVAALVLACRPPSPALANGGTLRLANVPMGAYLVSVFTDPTPVRPDSLDVSVLVVMRGLGGGGEGLDVRLRTRHLEGLRPEEERPATREQADDPRYYAAKFGLGAEGPWEIQVTVRGPEGSGEASFEVRARDRGLLGNPAGPDPPGPPSPDPGGRLDRPQPAEASAGEKAPGSGLSRGDPR
jgi:hypothetical protein